MTKCTHLFGDGVAALCCARVLAQCGWSIQWHHGRKARDFRLLLNGLTVTLIEGLFDISLASLEIHPLQLRYTAWGEGGTPVRVEEPSFSVRGQDLVECLAERFLRTYRSQVTLVCEDADIPSEEPASNPSDWVVWARGKTTLQSATRRHWGRRVALIADAELTDPADSSSSWMESTPEGWVFMFPSGLRKATIQAVVAVPDSNPDEQLRRILSSTRVVGSHIRSTNTSKWPMDAAPSMADLLCGAHTVKVGEEAICFDPVCGDGTGHAIRGAILAASVMNSGANGLARDAALEHYRRRVQSALLRHLHSCLSLYQTANFGPAWRTELDASSRGIASLTQALDNSRGFAFQLQEFDLVPVPSA